MARKDGTGPLGMGPLTGRGLGLCRERYSSYRRPRLGPGYGQGRGFRRRYERTSVEEEKAILEARLKDINKILDQSQDQYE